MATHTKTEGIYIFILKLFFGKPIVKLLWQTHLSDIFIEHKICRTLENASKTTE